jgi:hypothetical protein
MKLFIMLVFLRHWLDKDISIIPKSRSTTITVILLVTLLLLIFLPTAVTTTR